MNDIKRIRETKFEAGRHMKPSPQFKDEATKAPQQDEVVCSRSRSLSSLVLGD